MIHMNKWPLKVVYFSSMRDMRKSGENCEKVREENSEKNSKEFSRQTHQSEFKSHNNFHLHTTTVYCLDQWIVAAIDPNGGDKFQLQIRHPLTLKKYLLNPSTNIDLSKLNPTTLTFSHHFNSSSFDKLLVLPPPSPNNKCIDECTLLVLYDGGQLRGRLPLSTGEPWVKLHFNKFDDIAIFEGNIYAVDRHGMLYLINNSVNLRRLSIGKTVIAQRLHTKSGLLGWRKRLVVDGYRMRLVVRNEEKMFEVYKMVPGSGLGIGSDVNWVKIVRFCLRDQVLFMARDFYFFRPAGGKFPGNEFRHCIVFSEAAFPKYGNDSWEFSQFGRQLSEEDIAVFRFDDGSFGREGETGVFPEINWSPPPWTFHACSNFAAESSQPSSSSESDTQSEREPEEDEGLNLNSRDENDGEVQSDLVSQDKEQDGLEYDSEFSDSRDENDKKLQARSSFAAESSQSSSSSSESDTQSERDSEEDGGLNLNSIDGNDGEVQSDLIGQDKEHDGLESGSDSEDENDKMQSDQNSHVSQAKEDEVTRTLSINGGIDAIEQGTSRKNISQSIPTACRSCRTKCHICDSVITKFEGFDVRSDLVPTLQKIWQKHGNIIENSTMRSGYVLARALESLAIMVQILEVNSTQSLSDSEAEYLSITLSDLRCICFKLEWLVPFVEKAVKLHNSKPLIDSLNNLSQLSSQVEERRAILFDEIAKLAEEGKKLKEEIAKVFEMISFSGKMKFDESLGLGLT